MSQRTHLVSCLSVLATLSVTSLAAAEDAKVALDASTAVVPPVERAEFVPHVEAGIFGGLLFVSKDHELFKRHHESFRTPAPELGARFALFPLDHAGIEGEFGAGPTRTESNVRAGLWAARGHLVLQIPGKIAPFAVGGIGALGASSNVTGSDKDLGVHFGLGVKYWADPFLGIRLDLRDTVAPRHLGGSKSAQAHNPELLLGLSFALDAPAAPVPPPPDRDADEVADADDQCPDQKGLLPEGCPPPPDGDDDGIIDEYDGCPAEAGPKPTGCPDKDPDYDCVPLPGDKCPAEAGILPDGCPDPDPDRDGVSGAGDKCPKDPETKNEFEDADGCPDTVPEKVKKFSGVIPGIEFDTGKATIRPVSRPTLDEAASVLVEYTALKVAISGHTDNVGDKNTNIELSKARADAVKEYLVGKGVAADRITTRGAGPNEPIADNATRPGRQQNRRIEFALKSE
jgi:outer membrane protein OmpA-like peptidoglycan-associated protein